MDPNASAEIQVQAGWSDRKVKNGDGSLVCIAKGKNICQKKVPTLELKQQRKSQLSKQERLSFEQFLATA